jgi:hypothetical protein
MNMELEREAPPEAALEEETLSPRGPWRFLSPALPGGFSGPGLQLILAWLGFQVLSSSLWAQHLLGLAGWSSLPTYWGEQLSARDVWELMENGKLFEHPFGFWTPLFALGFLAWALWAGWKIQAAAAESRAGFGPWILGLVDALLIGLLPILLVEGALTWFLQKLGGTGIQGLGWANLVGGTLVRLVAVSAFLLQWWLCRANRAGAASGGFRLGSWTALARHLGHSFLRLWLNAGQWGMLLTGGVILRFGLHFFVLVLAWRWGGATPARVWLFLGLQALATFLAAWAMGWMLRVTGQFWRHDFRVRQEIQNLRRRAAGQVAEG